MIKFFKLYGFLLSIFFAIAGLISLFNIRPIVTYYDGLQEGVLVIDTLWVRGPARYRTTVYGGTIDGQSRRYATGEKELAPYLETLGKTMPSRRELEAGKFIEISVWFNANHKWYSTEIRDSEFPPTGETRLWQQVWTTIGLFVPLLLFGAYWWYQRHMRRGRNDKDML